MARAFGFGASESSSRNEASASQQIDPTQLGFLANLWASASGLANRSLGPVTLQANQLGGGLLTSGQRFIEGLSGAAGGLGAGVNSAIGGLLGFGGASTPGNALIQSAGAGAGGLLSGPNPGLQAQTSVLSDMIQANLAATQGTIASQATLGGATGGSRQALATGLAAQEAQRQFGAGASNLVSQDFAARQALAPQLLGTQLAAGQALNAGPLQQSALQLQALQSAGSLGNAGRAGQIGAGTAGLGGLGGLFDLGMGTSMAGFQPLLALASILGGPTVLSESESSGESSSSAFRFGLGAGG